MNVLNVGSGPSRDLPDIYRGCEQTTLDVDAAAGPDLVRDARELTTLPAGRFDAVFCSHCLEHFHEHDVAKVLGGFAHVLRPDGFANVIVPDMAAVFEAVVKGGRDVEDVWYVSPGGPIRFLDVVYGWQKQVAAGNEFYCHKTGFTAASLGRALSRAGFARVLTAEDGSSLHAFAFRQEPSPELLMRLCV